MKPYFDYSIVTKDIAIASHQNGLVLYDIANKQGNFLLKLEELLALPYSIYLLDTNGSTLLINEVGASICGFPSSTNAIGKTIFDVSKGNSSDVLLDNCKLVLEQESVKMFDEVNLRHDGRSLQFLSIKFPCYDSKLQLQGTLGISIVLGEQSLAEAISHLAQWGLIPKNTSVQEQKIPLNLGGVKLTPRELECLEYTVKGFTAKEIAKKLTISPRTVEEYINQIKLKLGVATKQHMIQKVLETT